jgi:hypothetical protein
VTPTRDADDNVTPIKRRRPTQRQGATKNAPTPAQLAARRERVAFLLTAKTPLSKIAEALGVSESTIDRDVRAIRAAWEASATASLDHHVANELAALDEVERRVWADHLTQRPVDQNAVRSLLQIHDRRARLLGLDRPRRIEVTGADGAPLIPPLIDDTPLLDDIDRLSERLAVLPRRAPVGTDTADPS